MKSPSFLRRSLGITQAVSILLASLSISVMLSAVQLSYSLKNQQQAAIELCEEILTLAEGGATTANWTLDTRVGKEVINSVIALGDVQSATLRDENHTVLATASRAPRNPTVFKTWFANHFIGEAIERSRTLSVPAGGIIQNVGTITVRLSPEQIAAEFFSVAKLVLLAGLFQALAIALVLLWLSSRLVTSPLRKAAVAIDDIDAENPQSMVVQIPLKHAENELGNLLGHTNKMVERLSHVQEQLRTLATHDPLTKLPNRSFVVSRLERAIVRADRSGTNVAVLFLDLDKFKSINDSHGHTYGDQILVKVANRIRDVLRSNDSVGRLGGDEFLIVVEDIHDGEDAVPTIQRIESKLAEPFEIGNVEFKLDCSIGVAIYPDDGRSATKLMRHSDMAMYQAKGDRGSNFHFFAKEMSERMQARLEMEAALRKAILNDEFVLVYQAKIDAATGELAGCEALLRWQHEDELITAGTFISIAEQIGIMVEIGDFVLEQACAQIRSWANLNQAIPVAINVSAQQLRTIGFADRVIEMTKLYQIEPGMLELEITETVLIEELDHATEKLNKLRAAGFEVSIDDFGTGYSSLAYLTHLPASSLKIDRSFVSGSLRSDVVLNMIIAMAKALNLTIVAEGIETEEQRVELIAKGCDMLQGFLLGRPIPVAEFEKLFLSPAA